MTDLSVDTLVKIATGAAPRFFYPEKMGVHDRRWTAQEEHFVADHLSIMPLEQLAATLDRSVGAIHVRQVRHNIPAPSKRPGWLTGNQVADALGSDIHSIMRMHRTGIMPLETIPNQRKILQIRQVRLYMWATNPHNWIYFRVQNMGDKHLQRLVQLAQSRWDDEWWTTGQVAAYHHTDVRNVTARILRGKLKARRWGNWYILRSVARKLNFTCGKGHNFVFTWTPSANAFILRSKANGLTYESIARMMKMKPATIAYHYLYLKRHSQKEGTYYAADTLFV